MKIKISSLFGLMLFLSASDGHLFSFEGPYKGFKPMEQIEQPKTAEDAKLLKDRVEKAMPEVEKAEERITRNRSAIDDRGSALTPEENKKLSEQIEEDQALVATYKKAEQVLAQEDVQQLLTEYQAQLATDFQSSLASDPNSLASASKGFVKVTFESAKTPEDIASYSKTVDALYNIDAIQKQVQNEPNVETKLSILQKQREAIEELKGKVTKALQDTALSNEFKTALQALSDKLDQKISRLDGVNIELYTQNAGFFTRVARSIVNWFARNFDFKKPATLQRSITSELAIISQNKKNLASINALLKDLTRLQDNVKGMRDAVSVTPVMDQKTFDNLQDRIKALEALLVKLEKGFTPKEQDLINQTAQTFQELARALFAKTKRYVDRTKFATLFDSELDANTKETLGTVSPDRLYDLLGFGPDQNPEQITQEQIDAAYQKQMRAVQADPQLSKAVRNASTTLRNPTMRANYDAFVKDYRALENMGIDPRAPKSARVNTYLNNQGELSKLEITKQQHDAIATVLANDLQMNIADLGTKTSDEEKNPNLDAFQNVRKSLDAIKKTLDDAFATQKRGWAGASQPPV
jgi:hypothetical protein